MHASASRSTSRRARGHSHGRAPAPTAADAGARQPWTILALLAVAQFMVILDVTVVNVALPSIAESLRFTTAQLSWVITAYVLFTGGLMLLGGRLADLAGRRPVFLTGLAVFTVASLMSGLAWSPVALIASRAVQGVGAALLLPSALSIVTTTYSGPQRAVALAVWGALGSAGAAAGVLLGGVLTTLLSWEWIFFVNVPIGIAVAVAALHRLPTARAARPRPRLDLAGGVALMGGLFALVLAIEGTSTHGWTSTRTLALAAAAAVLLTGFAVLERRAQQPLVPPALWRSRSLVSGAAVMLAATGVLVGAFFLNTLYLQDVLDASALETGLAFLPLTLVILAGAHVASHLLPRVGSRRLMVSGLAMAAGGAMLLSGAPHDASYLADMLPGFLAVGFGVGMTFVSVSVAAMADVAHDRAGLASGLMTTAHELGAAIGVAVLSAVVVAGSGIAAGYGDGFLVAGAVAAVAAIAGAVVVPSVRPPAGAAHAMH